MRERAATSADNTPRMFCFSDIGIFWYVSSIHQLIDTPRNGGVTAKNGILLRYRECPPERGRVGVSRGAGQDPGRTGREPQILAHVSPHHPSTEHTQRTKTTHHQTPAKQKASSTAAPGATPGRPSKKPSRPSTPSSTRRARRPTSARSPRPASRASPRSTTACRPTRPLPRPRGTPRRGAAARRGTRTTCATCWRACASCRRGSGSGRTMCFGATRRAGS